VKGNCVNSGPSGRNFIVIASYLKGRLPDTKYYFIMSFNFPGWTWGSSYWRTPKLS